MVRKGISPTPNSKINAKASSHVTTMMHERSLVQHLIAETYNNGRFYQQTPALQSSAVYPLLYRSDKSQSYRAGT